MKKVVHIAFIALLCLVIAGCEDKEPDCTRPASKAEREKCAHQESTKPIGPDTLPKNPKRWGLDGEQK